MARNETAGTKQPGQAISAPLWDEFVKFCKGRGETIRWHMETALRRHLANPPPLPAPPPEPPPLPPIPCQAPQKKRKKGKA